MFLVNVTRSLIKSEVFHIASCCNVSLSYFFERAEFEREAFTQESAAATCGPALREKSWGTVIVYHAGCRSQDTKTLFIRMQLHM